MDSLNINKSAYEVTKRLISEPLLGKFSDHFKTDILNIGVSGLSRRSTKAFANS
jgi:hypothetical protein